MKVTHEFNLPEDREEHLRAVRSLNLCAVIWEMKSWLRGKVKYPPDDIKDGALKAYEEAYEMLFQIMDKENIDLDELYS